jgi:hypothetical protein
MGSAADAILLESYDLNISAIVDENPGWSQRMVNDYFSKQSNINALAQISDTDAGQIIINKENIEILQGEMTALTVIVTKNTADILINAAAIVVVQVNLDTHESSVSAHGVTGDNVGSGNFCTLTVGGVAMLSAAVVNATTSSVTVTASDATDLPTVIALSNELSADMTQLVTDVNGAIGTLNDLIQKLRDAKQLDL